MRYKLAAAAVLGALTLFLVAATQPPTSANIQRTVYTDPAYPLVIDQPPGQYTASGDQAVVQRTPVVSVDATYGITERLETSSGTNGTATASNGLFTCSTSADVGSYAEIRSARAVRVRPGEGATFRFDAAFSSTHPLNSLQAAFAFNAVAAYGFGYDGTNGFGLFRRYGGAIEIRRLTLSAGASGSESITVTLDNVPIAVTVTSGSTTLNAFEIASDADFATGGWDAWSNGATVTFIASTGAGAKSGAYSYVNNTGGGTSAGTIASIQAGASNTYEWVYQDEWSDDQVDGRWATVLTNASRMTLDPTKLNNYEIRLASGEGPALFYVLGDADSTHPGEPILVHTMSRANDATTPGARTPAYNVGWTAASLGSAAAMTVAGSFAMGAIDGERASEWNSKAASGVNASVSSSMWVNVLAIRNRGEFASTVNLAEIWPEAVAVFTDSTKGAEFRLLRNPTFDTSSVKPAWTYLDQTNSLAVYATEALPYTDQGEQIYTGVAGNTSAANISLANIPLVLGRGDVLSIAAQVVSGASSSVTAAMTWQEDY